MSRSGAQLLRKPIARASQNLFEDGAAYAYISHGDKLALKVGSDKKLLLQWTSLGMMRRYLAAN